MAASNSEPEDANALLVHFDWVKRLARRLVADADLAEDVAQETWLAAAKHPPRAGSNMHAWLGRVVKNAARQLGRSEAARSRRERAVAARAIERPSDEELHGSVEVQRRLAACVMALDEPYRRTVILRYFRDLSPRAIAAQEELPLATVKTRLRRALAQLRERVEREYAEGGGSWLPALAALGAPSVHNAMTIGGMIVGGKTLLGVSAAFVMLVLVAVWYWGPEGAPKSPELSPASSEVVHLDPVVQLHADVVETSPEALLGEGPESERTAIDQPSKMQALLVIDGVSGVPVGEAQVWLMAQSAVPEQVSEARGQYDPEPDARALGRRLETDPQGVVLLPPVEELHYVVARRGDLFGIRFHSSSVEVRPELHLWKDRTLSVRVIDSSRNPAPGVSVALRAGTGRSASKYWVKRTDEDGLAVMRHVGTGFYGLLDARANYYAGLDIPSRNPIEALVDPDAFPREPVTLALPETGKVTVELRDSEGALYPMRTWLYLHTLVQDPADPVARHGPRFGQWLDHKSRAVFAHVGLGLELYANVDETGVLKAAEMLAMGPRAPGEEVVVTLEVGGTHAFFFGRLIDEAGEPISNMRLAIASATYIDGRGERRSAGNGGVMGEDGRFQIPIDPGILQSGRSYSLRFQTSYQPGPVLRGEIEAEGLAPGEEVDCGDVVLSAVPPAVQGRVVDDRGDPLYQVWMLGGKSSLWSEGVSRWGFGVPLPGVYTRADGRFEMVGALDTGEYALWPKKKGYTSPGWTPFAVGAMDVEITMTREAVVAGLVLVDEGFPVERLSVFIDHPAADPVSEWFLSDRSSVRPSGAYRVEGLRPGTVRVIVQSGPYSGEFHVVPGVELTPGECQDRRVLTLDLRDRLHTYEIQVVDDAGNPIPTGYVIARPGEAGEESRVYKLEAGRATWISDVPVVDLEILASGFRTATVNGISDARRVVLERGVPATLRLPSEVELPPDPYLLEVGLHPADREEYYDRECYDQDSTDRDGWHRPRVDPHGAFTLDRELTLFAPSTGRFEVRWTVVDHGAADRGSSTAPVRAARRHVEVGSTVEPIEVHPDAADYQRTLDRLR